MTKFIVIEWLFHDDSSSDIINITGPFTSSKEARESIQFDDLVEADALDWMTELRDYTPAVLYTEDDFEEFIGDQGATFFAIYPLS